MLKLKPILWPPDAKNWLTGKHPDAGKDWRWEEKGTTEDEMVGWHYGLDRCWVWVNSGSGWWTGGPSVLQSIGLQRAGHDWATELHTVKGHGVVNKAEVDVFLECSCFFDDPMEVGNLISGFSAFSKTSLNIWKFSVHILLEPGLENFEHWFPSVWDECSCAVVWAFFGITFPWDWNENWPFPVLWPLLRFPNLLAYWV